LLTASPSRVPPCDDASPPHEPRPPHRLAPALAVAVVTRIAVGLGAPHDHARAAVEMPVDGPEGPRPHRLPWTAHSRDEPHRPDGHAPGHCAGHAPFPRPVPSAHDPRPRPPPIPPSGPGSTICQHRCTHTATSQPNNQRHHPRRPGSAGTTVRDRPDQVSGIAGLRTQGKVSALLCQHSRTSAEAK